MMQSADLGNRDHATFLWGLHTSWRGRVFLQREMRARSVVISDITGQNAPEMPLAEYDHVVQTFVPD